MLWALLVCACLVILLLISNLECSLIKMFFMTPHIQASHTAFRQTAGIWSSRIQGEVIRFWCVTSPLENSTIWLYCQVPHYHAFNSETQVQTYKSQKHNNRGVLSWNSSLNLSPLSAPVPIDVTQRRYSFSGYFMDSRHDSIHSLCCPGQLIHASAHVCVTVCQYLHCKRKRWW